MGKYKDVVDALRNYFYKTSFDGKTFEKDRVDALINDDVIASLQQDRMRLKWAYDVSQEIQSYFYGCRVEGRIKSIYSILYKMLNADEIAEAALRESEKLTKDKKDQISFRLLKENPMDAIGFKIICSAENSCYDIMKKLENIYSIIYFKDRIISPKPSGYKDIRMIALIRVEEGDPTLPVATLPVEIIIQSEKMYNDSKEGIQCHKIAYPWKYSNELLALAEEFQTITIQ